MKQITSVGQNASLGQYWTIGCGPECSVMTLEPRFGAGMGRAATRPGVRVCARPSTRISGFALGGRRESARDCRVSARGCRRVPEIREAWRRCPVVPHADTRVSAVYELTHTLRLLRVSGHRALHAGRRSSLSECVRAHARRYPSISRGAGARSLADTRVLPDRGLHQRRKARVSRRVCVLIR